MVRDRRRNPKKRHQNKEKNRALQHAKTRSLNDHYTTTDVLIDRVIKKKKRPLSKARDKVEISDLDVRALESRLT